MKSGFRPLLFTCRLNWARRTSWGWWDEWDDTALQTQDSKFKPWRSEAEHATYRSRRLQTILSFTSRWGRNICISFKSLRPGNEPRALAWKAAVLTTTLGPPATWSTITLHSQLRMKWSDKENNVVVCFNPFKPDFTLSSYPLQAANCCHNSRLVDEVDEDDLKWVKN